MSFKNSFKNQANNNRFKKETLQQDHPQCISRFYPIDLTTNLIGANSKILIVYSWMRMTLIPILNKNRIKATVIRR
jgi:hypothetical protein